MSTRDELTPMMRQYQAIKQQYPGTILMFRLGDFYEMFYDDAIEAAKILNLTLTRRGTQKGEDVPMCGVPYHAAEVYIGRLLRHNKRVAICDQIEDPRTAKGIVKRAVTRVVTPATTFDERQLPHAANNFLVALYPLPSPKPSTQPSRIGIAALDVTTGTFEVCEVRSMEALRQELVRIQPREVLLPPHATPEAWHDFNELFGNALLVKLDDVYFDDGRNTLLKHFGVITLDGFGCERLTCGVAAAGAALRYVRENLPQAGLEHIRAIRVFHREQHMILDEISRRNLELTHSLRDGSVQGTLLGVLDETATPMGARLLRQWIIAPLLDIPTIRARQDAIEAIMRAQHLIPPLQHTLRRIGDIERLASRLGTGYGTPRDLAGLRNALQLVPQLHQHAEAICAHAAVSAATLPVPELRDQEPTPSLLNKLLTRLCVPADLLDTLERALVDDPPLKLQEGGIIKPGFNAELDELRVLASSGKEWIAQLQLAESNRTGIKSLKVGYNKVFGYYIEVTKPNLHLVPPDYIRKQTIANGERFITPELKEMESRILNAEERARQLEYDLFQELRLTVAAQNAALQELAQAVATLDVLQNLAWIALRRNYCRPVVNSSDVIRITAGRHPVVESLLPEHQFVPNDTFLNTTDNQIMILTGPNMSGKSTYIRQNALLVLMAQMGSFIPATAAEIGIVDRIFTRVGASDELSRGQSTFMVEMTETANILNNATPRSLIILDEIGRGTSTYDGLAIAWSVVEYLHNCPTVKAKTLFATHYHELIQLEHQLPGVVNYNVAVREHEDSVIFMHQIVRGGTDRSYGIHVARLAGLPAPVIARAKTILQHLEQAHQEQATEKLIETVPTVGGTAAACGPARGSHSRSEETTAESQLVLF
ncbi:MAG: DNA mismatch repair protein MutS [bacterium]|nr:DNA mismatch repair protein MutS [bacterium]